MIPLGVSAQLVLRPAEIHAPSSLKPNLHRPPPGSGQIQPPTALSRGALEAGLIPWASSSWPGMDVHRPSGALLHYTALSALARAHGPPFTISSIVLMRR